MTTVVVDMDNQEIVTDSQATTIHCDGVVTYDDNTIKVFNSVLGGYYVGTGNLDVIHAMIMQLDNSGGLFSVAKQAKILYITADNDFTRVVTYKTVPSPWYKINPYEWEVTEAKYHRGTLTMGSGGDYAAGALAAGVTPTEAIIAAAKLDQYTNCKVHVTSYKEGE